MNETARKQDVYDRIGRAYKRSTGLRLSAEDVDLLMSDTAIRDVVNETWAEPEPKPNDEPKKI